MKANQFLYAPDPSSQSACTIGGNVATNSGGPHTLKYGVTTNHVLGFEIVLPDGEVTWLGTTPDGGEDVEGYDLRGAVIGCGGDVWGGDSRVGKINPARRKLIKRCLEFSRASHKPAKQ